ncbi:MAG: CRISPR-associated protein Cas4 [Phototrophicales bacterium]|nr:MAG: CRISPR-associated protein Cas4 [Phototrophicales bacterium]RMG73634.1 MAG: CRISPR-associated protein Cas4 [Chloroflexota bacterium]
MLDSIGEYFTVTDLKQYIYCPRILYYHTFLANIRPMTYKMEAGIEAHRSEPKRALRRNMGLAEETIMARYFDLILTSDRLGLSAQIDEVIELTDELIPIDYKLAKRIGYHFKIQLCAYALLLEEHFQLKVKHGFLYLILRRQAEEILIDSKLRYSVQRALADMAAIRASEAMPPATKFRKRCIDCEFRKFCNDV